jgi:ABC-2 type transport system permease protein
VLPLVGVCAYVFVYRATALSDLISCVILGGAMSALMNVLWAMGNQLFWEKETGNLALYIMAPNSMMAILLGMALGGMVTTTLRAASILAIGSLMFGVRFDVSNAPLLLLVFALALVALYGMGMMFASMFLLFGREGWHLVNLAQEPVFCSGHLFPSGASICRRRVDHSADARLDAIRQLSFLPGAALGFLDVRSKYALAAMSVVFWWTHVFSCRRSAPGDCRGRLTSRAKNCRLADWQIRRLAIRRLQIRRLADWEIDEKYRGHH